MVHADSALKDVQVSPDIPVAVKHAPKHEFRANLIAKSRQPNQKHDADLFELGLRPGKSSNNNLGGVIT